MSRLITRWATWWVTVCTLIWFALRNAGQSCRDTLQAGWGECTELELLAYESGTALTIQLGLIALIGALALHRLQRRWTSRACPRCGHRVPIGQLTCSPCGYDFTERS